MNSLTIVYVVINISNLNLFLRLNIKFLKTYYTKLEHMVAFSLTSGVTLKEKWCNKNDII